MRNLKRALSLTLASVMLLGMMVVGSSAASYPDVEDTHNVEAIEVLKTIKVMVGDDNGNFGPDDQVNRAQMAVVMALLLDLDYDYYKGTNPFWDVPSWAEPYVAACYANGIVSGYNATTYGSGDPVTAVQAASMMMRALGYFKYQSDYKDGFELATVRQASKISLFKDVNASSNNAALTRNQVAQLALNTLESTVVDAKDNTLSINTGANAGNISITGGQVDYIVRTSTEPFAYAFSDNQETGDTSTSGNTGATVQLGEQLFNGDLKKDVDRTGFNRASITDDFERPATRWTYKFSEIGTYADTPDYTYTTSISGDTPADKVKNMGLKGYKWDGTYYENGRSATATGSDDAARLGDLAANVAADGVLIEVYMDDTNTDTIDTVTVIRTQMMQVNAVSSSEVTLKKLDDNKRDGVGINAGGSTVSMRKGGTDFLTVKTVKEDDPGYDVLKNLKTDDYVLIVPVKDNSQEKVASAVVPETVTGVLEAINTKSTDGKVKSIKVAGETYKMSYTWTSEDDEMHRGTKLTSKQECQVYLDTYGNAIYVKDVEANNSAIIVDYIYSAVENGKIVKYAEGWDSTGNEISLNLGTSPNLFGSESAAQGKVFEYKTSNVNDADYELIQPAMSWALTDPQKPIVYGYTKNGTDAANQTISYGQYNGLIGDDRTAGTRASLPFDSAVKFIFVSKEGADVTGITVKTGVSEVKSNDGTTDVGAALTYILNGNRDKIVAVVVPNDDDAGNTASLLYLEAITSHSNNSNNKRVAYATVWIDGEKSTNVELNKDYGSSAVDQFYTYSEANGVYTLTPYTKTNKVTSVACGQVLGSELTGAQDYWFNVPSTGTYLNAKDAKVFDLYGDDGKFYDSVKGMQDAINNGDVSEDTHSPIVDFKVSYVYNGDVGDSGYNTVKYVFITKSNTSGGSSGGSNVVDPDTELGDTTVSPKSLYINGTMLVSSTEAERREAITAALENAGYSLKKFGALSTANGKWTGPVDAVKDGDEVTFNVEVALGWPVYLNGATDPVVALYNTTASKYQAAALKSQITSANGTSARYATAAELAANEDDWDYDTKVNVASVMDNVTATTYVETGFVKVTENGTDTFVPYNQAYTVPAKGTNNGTGYTYAAGAKYVIYGGTIDAADMKTDVTLTKDQIRVTYEGFTTEASNKVEYKAYNASDIAIPASTGEKGTGVMVTGITSVSYLAYGTTDQTATGEDVTIEGSYLELDGFATTISGMTEASVAWKINGKDVTTAGSNPIKLEANTKVDVTATVTVTADFTAATGTGTAGHLEAQKAAGTNAADTDTGAALTATVKNATEKAKFTDANNGDMEIAGGAKLTKADGDKIEIAFGEITPGTDKLTFTLKYTAPQ